MTAIPGAVDLLGAQLEELGWVRGLFVAGSLATGDYVPGVSDLDLVALVVGPVTAARVSTLAALHRRLDALSAKGLDLGCAYVSADELPHLQALRPTWTHGQLVHRILSGVTRAELVLHGLEVFGPPVLDVLSPMDQDDVREAARAELLGYWAWAVRRPWLWLDPSLADLGLTSMARGRHSLATGELLAKSRAVGQADAPAHLLDELRARRHGEDVTSPRLRMAWTAWRDAHRTVALAHRAR